MAKNCDLNVDDAIFEENIPICPVEGGKKNELSDADAASKLKYAIIEVMDDMERYLESIKKERHVAECEDIEKVSNLLIDPESVDINTIISERLQILAEQIVNVKIFHRLLDISYDNRDAQFEEFKKLNDIPKNVLMKIVKDYPRMYVPNSHYYETICKQFGRQIKEFFGKVHDSFTRVCDCCNMLNRECEISRRLPEDEVLQYVKQELRKKDEFHFCRQCCRKIYKGELPKYAVLNNLDIYPTPPWLAELNWVELYLISLKKAGELILIFVLK